eukprot:937335-Rhodomonas_salina.1
MMSRGLTSRFEVANNLAEPDVSMPIVPEAVSYLGRRLERGREHQNHNTPGLQRSGMAFQDTENVCRQHLAHALHCLFDLVLLDDNYFPRPVSLRWLVPSAHCKGGPNLAFAFGHELVEQAGSSRQELVSTDRSHLAAAQRSGGLGDPPFCQVGGDGKVGAQEL